MAFCQIIYAEIEAQMFSTQSPPLNDVLQRDFDSENARSNGAGRLKPGRAYRSSGLKQAQFRSVRPSIGRRVTRRLARFFFVVFISVGGTLAWQHGDDVTEMVRTWVPSLGWLLPVSTTKAPAPVTTTDLQQQLKFMSIDLALVRRTEEQLATNQDQLARKQDQMAQAIAGLQAAGQDLSKQILALAPPAPKAVKVSSKPSQPPAE
jgi:hypothetical protein